MERSRTRIVSVAILCGTAALSAPVKALAWGNAGHEAVAYVAWQQMNPTARKEAIALIRKVPRLTAPPIKTNPAIKVDGYTQWVAALPAGLSSDDRDMFLFMRASTWADTIKHVGFADSDDPPPHVTVDHPVGFKDKASHGYWHFVDNGMTADGSTVLTTPIPNAAVQIVELRKDLGDAGADPKLRAYELVWLEHLVGDIHQPLHGVRRFVANKSDLGGNSVKISVPSDIVTKLHTTPPNLHSFWDDLPGSGSPRSALTPAAEFAKSLAPADPNDVKETDPQHWAEESFEIAKRDGYVSPIGPKNKTSTGKNFGITDPYYDQALADAKVRVALAGARLAKMLNDIWPAATAQ